MAQLGVVASVSTSSEVRKSARHALVTRQNLERMRDGALEWYHTYVYTLCTNYNYVCTYDVLVISKGHPPYTYT